MISLDYLEQLCNEFLFDWEQRYLYFNCENDSFFDSQNFQDYLIEFVEEKLGLNVKNRNWFFDFYWLDFSHFSCIYFDKFKEDYTN
jgi:hypothetical protein